MPWPPLPPRPPSLVAEPFVELPSPPAGSLAGGPNATLADPVALEKLAGCAGSRCYIDDIGAWGVNEITINWNAALLQAASFLADAE